MEDIIRDVLSWPEIVNLSRHEKIWGVLNLDILSRKYTQGVIDFLIQKGGDINHVVEIDVKTSSMRCGNVTDALIWRDHRCNFMNADIESNDDWLLKMLEYLLKRGFKNVRIIPTANYDYFIDYDPMWGPIKLITPQERLHSEFKGAKYSILRKAIDNVFESVITEDELKYCDKYILHKK